MVPPREICRFTTGLRRGACRLARAAVVRDLPDLVVPEPEHLEQLAVVVETAGAPPEPDHEAVCALGHDVRRRGHARIDHQDPLLEDRPGLVRAVSSRRLAPPPPAPFESLPVQVRMQQADQRIDVTRDRCVVGLLDLLRAEHRNRS